MGRKILKAVAGVFVVIIVLLGIFAIYLGIKVFSIHRERKQVSEAYEISEVREYTLGDQLLKVKG